ncbi:hypothetical protein D3C84_716230 [compost metagenome]
MLTLPGLGHLLGDRGGIVPGFALGGQRRGFPGDGQVQVDAVQQRSGEFVAVALHHVRCTAAASAGLAKISTGARIHCRHQLETRREAYSVTGARHHDVPRLQRLSQDLQYPAVEFRQFIEKQHAMVGEGDFSWLRF